MDTDMETPGMDTLDEPVANDPDDSQLGVGMQVRILSEDGLWDGKKGTIEEIDGDRYTVSVDFLPGQGKIVRQWFGASELMPLDNN